MNRWVAAFLLLVIWTGGWMLGDKVVSGNQLSLEDEMAAALFEMVMSINEPKFDLARYPQQDTFVNVSEHHVAFVGGIGSGKTIGGCIRGLLAAYGFVGGEKVIPTPNLGIITAPTYPMLRDATLRAFFEIADGYIANFNKSEMLVTLNNGSEIIFRSVDDPEKGRGPSAAWWFGDEASLYQTKVRPIMLGRLRQFGQQGYEWLATTPKGLNFVWQVFVRDAKPDHRLIKARSRDNVYLDEAVLADWESSYSGDFARQELDGEFVAFEGLIYATFDRMRHVIGQLPMASEAYAGVDWGFANPGVIWVGQLDADKRLMGVHEEYVRRRRIEEWVEVGKQLRDIWNIRTFYCDPSEPDYIKKFNEAGLKAVAANNTVTTGIQAVANRLVVQADGRPRLQIHSSMVQTATEFEQYQWMENKHGLRDQPVKANDHTMDALRYLVMGIDEPGRRSLSVEVRPYA